MMSRYCLIFTLFINLYTFNNKILCTSIKEEELSSNRTQLSSIPYNVFPDNICHIREHDNLELNFSENHSSSTNNSSAKRKRSNEVDISKSSLKASKIIDDKLTYSNSSSCCLSTSDSTKDKTNNKKHIDHRYSKFCELVKKGSHTVSPIKEISVKDEEIGGSRKWVKSFSADSNQWHKKAARIVQKLRVINDNEHFMPVEVNIAMVRLIFHFKDKPSEPDEAKFFFISGWPANNNTLKESVTNFSKRLANKQLGIELEPYKDYGIRFFTKMYKNGTEKSHRNLGYNYDKSKSEFKKIFEKELNHPDRKLNSERIKNHLNIFEEKNDNSLFAQLYLHSEQSIPSHINNRIKVIQNESKVLKSKPAISTDSRTSSSIILYSNLKLTSSSLDQSKIPTKSLSQNKLIVKSDKNASSKNSIHHITVDIHSYYDMCWCCGDTLLSCCHDQEYFQTSVCINLSGSVSYRDAPFGLNSLRQNRHQFATYLKSVDNVHEQLSQSQPGKVYYLPFIAHAAVDELP